MKNGRYLYYFDTCVFLHWLVDAAKRRDVVEGIEEIVTAAERGESAIIVTSTITRIEVLKSKMGAKEAEQFARMLGQFVVQSANVDPKVGQIRRKIAEFADG